MSNPLPPGTIPKLRRIKKDGKFVGNYSIHLDGKKINLFTDDFFTARERARQAVEDGKREFTEDRNPPPVPTAIVPIPALAPIESTNEQAGDFASDVAKAAEGATYQAVLNEPEQKPPITPDAVFPPTLPPMIERREWAGDGAQESDPKPGEQPATPPPEGEEWTKIPPEMIDGIISQIADTLVTLQIDGQAWLVERLVYKKQYEAGVILPGTKGREIPKQFWESWLKKSFPAEVPLPEWVVAMAACATFTLPVQIAKATKKPEKET